MSIINSTLDIQRKAWNFGHENYGASIDVESEILTVLKGFKHLNPVQLALKTTLESQDELKYAYSLCSAARKVVRHYVVTLK
ncbi:lysis inhibition; accessory protein [Pectobacterium bacteriophage PM2]|uniref:Lysis inhibition accessory protein n=1 Tax=Pectobacterium bacteriophage PM2 TaxID=1429794 RepID=A0A0A0Q0W1_9CAUD|nr:lysis inhibition; accessory protein [Pectobacterium bacteriophage PM2]AHY25193.1 lysis inhibition accessory protein [Pectobacterium bacteriophage PM2]